MPLQRPGAAILRRDAAPACTTSPKHPQAPIIKHSEALKGAVSRDEAASLALICVLPLSPLCLLLFPLL